MAGRRLRWNQPVRRDWRILAIWGLLACFAPIASIRAATTEYVITDRFSGLAINGFDPVAYFTDRLPRLGKGEFEYRYAGTVWRFCNEGNRAAFAAHPDVYAPKFGGYDPVAIARGAPVAGDPLLWMVTGNRLYFFHTQQNLLSFKRDTAAAIEAATRQWPSVQYQLSP